MASKNNRVPLPGYIKLWALLESHQWISTGVTVWKGSIQVKIGDFFVLFNHEIWWMILKMNRVPLVSYFKLCASFHSHRSIQTGFIVWKVPIWFKISDFLSCVTLKFDGWPWKKIGYLFYATSSFVHHIIAIDLFDQELQSKNAKFGWKSTLFCPEWPWNLMDDLKNNRASLLCYLKLCALYHSRRSIHIGVTVWKRWWALLLLWLPPANYWKMIFIKTKKTMNTHVLLQRYDIMYVT